MAIETLAFPHWQCEQDLLLTDEANSESRTTRSASPSHEIGYFDPPHADVMVQSSDLVNFRVNKLVLSVSSPFFADMFSLPQPPDNEVIDGLPVVRLSEDAETFNHLLTMLYPIPYVAPDGYDKAIQLLAAAQKYEMVGVKSSIRAKIISREPIVPTEAEAFRAFAVSSGAKLVPEMRITARYTLNFPMTLESLSDELPLFEGWALRDLVRYRKCCRDRLLSTFDSFLDPNSGPSKIWVVCTADSLNSGIYSSQRPGVFPYWLSSFLSKHRKNLLEALTNPFPNPSSMRGEYLDALSSHINSKDCIPCMRVHTLKGENFGDELENQLTQALDKVSTPSRGHLAKISVGLIHFS